LSRTKVLETPDVERRLRLEGVTPMATLRSRLEALERRRGGQPEMPDVLYWDSADGTGGYVLILATGQELTGAEARRWILENETAEGGPVRTALPTSGGITKLARPLVVADVDEGGQEPLAWLLTLERGITQSLEGEQAQAHNGPTPYYGSKPKVVK
jgi:hypothetical protein